MRGLHGSRQLRPEALSQNYDEHLRGIGVPLTEQPHQCWSGHSGKKNPDSSGSLGIAISEAIEMAVQNDTTKYALGSVLNHVLLHQTIIGQESIKQLEYAGDYPDVVIAPLGGGSNFAGIAFPFLHDNLVNGKNVRLLAVEPASCPKLTQGEFMYDFGDTAGYTPLLPMYTLGHNFQPAAIHAGGLRYHGASVLCSQLLKDGLIDAVALQQLECFEAGVKFAKSEGVIPAPEATHGIAQVIREAEQAKKRRQGENHSVQYVRSRLCGYAGFITITSRVNSPTTPSVRMSLRKGSRRFDRCSLRPDSGCALGCKPRRES